MACPNFKRNTPFCRNCKKRDETSMTRGPAVGILRRGAGRIFETNLWLFTGLSGGPTPACGMSFMKKLLVHLPAASPWRHFSSPPQAYSRPMISRLPHRRCFVMSYSTQAMPWRSTGPSMTAFICTRAPSVSTLADDDAIVLGEPDLSPRARSTPTNFSVSRSFYRGNFFVRIPYTVNGDKPDTAGANDREPRLYRWRLLLHAPGVGRDRRDVAAGSRTPERSTLATRQARSKASSRRPTKCSSRTSLSWMAIHGRNRIPRGTGLLSL